MEKVWISFRIEDGRLLCRKMFEAEAIQIANEKQWMPKTLDPEVGSALDSLVGHEDRWVTVGDLLSPDPFPDHLG